MPLETLVDKTVFLADALAARFAEEGRKALGIRSTFTVALPGGSVATSFFPRLAGLDFDWSRTDFFWGDERAVPPDHPDSNYGVARSLWLEPARVPEARIHRMRADAPDFAAAAEAYEGELTACAGSPARL